MALILQLTLVLYIAFVKGQFDVEPQNEYVKKGGYVVLKCTVTGAGTVDAQQMWREFYSSHLSSFIAVDEVVRSGYTVDFAIVTNTKYDLELKNGQADLIHGSQYTCENAFGTPVPLRKAELIILGSDPVCSSSISSNIVIENEVITYSCEINYRGKWAPVMQWKNKKNILIPLKNGSSTNFVKYSIDITARMADHEQQYTCTTKFADVLDPPPGTDAATNVPTYTYTYTSEVLTVHWHPTNTQILDINNNPIADGRELYLGEVIKCVTDSNPPPDTYIWRNNTDNKILGLSQSITVDLSWLGETSIICVVRNSMGSNNGITGQHHVLITIAVKPTTTTVTTTAKPLTSESTTDSFCTDFCNIDTNKDTVNAAIVGGVLGSLLTIICLVFGAFLLRVYIPITNIKGVDKPVDNQQSNTVYQNVDISREKPYVELDVNTREEEVNPYRNDYMELRVT